MTPRSAGQVHAGLLAIQPQGWALPDDPASVWGRLTAPLAAELARAEAQAATLGEELDPRRAVTLLPDFERVLGDDPCLGPAAALPTGLRQAVAWQRWTLRGGATPAYFVALAATLGVAVTVEEFWPTEYGDEYGGDYLPPGAQFCWVVHLPPTQVVEAEYGGTEYGGFYGEIIPSLAECPLRRAAPAHTTLIFSYAES